MFGCQSLWFTHYNQCFCVCRLSPKLQGIFQIGAESGTKLCILVVSWTLLNKCSMSERIWAIQKTEPNRPSRMLTETHHGGPRVDALLGVASFLVEAYIEGPHRSFNREHGRAFSSRIPWISSSMNFTTNMELYTRFCATQDLGGRDGRHRIRNVMGLETH